MEFVKTKRSTRSKSMLNFSISKKKSLAKRNENSTSFISGYTSPSIMKAHYAKRSTIIETNFVVKVFPELERF